MNDLNVLLTRLMQNVIDAAFDSVKSRAQRKKLYEKVIDSFQDAGWDDEQECLHTDDAYDSALRAVWKKHGHPRLQDLD